MTDTATTPKRVTLTDAYRDAQHVIDQLTTRTNSEPYVSVEFTRNAKGETQISMKVSAPGGVDQDELTRLSDRVYVAACATYEEACAKYPTGSGFVRNEGQGT